MAIVYPSRAGTDATCVSATVDSPRMALALQRKFRRRLRRH
ncbi:hypothetical protein [Lysobacter gummosus]